MKNHIRVPTELADIAPAYLQHRIQDVAVLKDALDRGDFEFLAGLAHKTKGTAGGYGFQELGNIAISLEMAAKSENREAARGVLAEMESYLANVVIED